jgi:hypothetical protein
MEGRVLEGRAQSRVEETRKLGFSRAERGWAHHPAVFCTLCTYTCKSPPGRHTKRNRWWAGGLGDEADFAGLRHTGRSGGCVGCGAGLGLIAGPGVLQWRVSQFNIPFPLFLRRPRQRPASHNILEGIASFLTSTPVFVYASPQVYAQALIASHRLTL